MTPGSLLELRAVSKYFCRDPRQAQRYGLADLARACNPLARQRTGPRRGEFPSVDDISFSIRPGEAVAIMGPNGAGKTTLLRLIAGLIRADIGDVRVRGRVNSVIELGQGLNPQLTGRENAELGLSFRGVGRAAVRDIIPAIATFAELDDAFDSPVGTYSTGMRMRLAFAIAVSAPCDLLLLDEVLAVGDMRFQRKCMARIQQFIDAGGSLILISHQIVQMLSVCERGIVVDHGKMVFDGDIHRAGDHLLTLLGERPSPAMHDDTNADDINIVDMRIVPVDDGPLRTGGSLDVELEFIANAAVELICGVAIWSGDLSVCVTGAIEPAPTPVLPGRHVRRCRFAQLPLMAGHYAVRCSILDPKTMHPFAMLGYNDPPKRLEIKGEINNLSVIQKSVRQLIKCDYSWDIGCGDSVPVVATNHGDNQEAQAHVG